MKAINIRNRQDKPEVGRAMGLFKKNAFKAGDKQQDYFLKVINFAYKNGMFDEKEVK